MSKNIIIGAVIGIIAIGGLSFFAGTKVASSGPESTRGGNFPAGAQGGFQQMGGGMGMNGGQRGGGQGGGGFVAGEVISKDAQSITIALQDGGSRIIFVTENTPVNKTVSGTAADIVVGEQVVVTGSTNQDGSVSAQSIQIGGMPGGMMRPNSN